MFRQNKTLFAISFTLVIVLSSCGGGGGTSTNATPLPAPQPPVSSTCTGFTDWMTSQYVLPYPVGTSYQLNQGNCSGFGHSGFWQYGYDFIMPIGTLVTASRDGVVDHAQDGAVDGDRTRTNLITIKHADGTVALYSHLTLNGVHVMIGQTVFAGDVIGQSGDTGNTGGLPHLHFSLHPCGSLPGIPGTDNCPTIAANFRNTSANPSGLGAGFIYEALPF